MKNRSEQGGQSYNSQRKNESGYEQDGKRKFLNDENYYKNNNFESQRDNSYGYERQKDDVEDYDNYISPRFNEQSNDQRDFSFHKQSQNTQKKQDPSSKNKRKKDNNNYDYKNQNDNLKKNNDYSYNPQQQSGISNNYNNYNNNNYNYQQPSNSYAINQGDIQNLNDYNVDFELNEEDREVDNAYDVSDGGSDYSLNLSDTENEETSNQHYLSKQRFLQGLEVQNWEVDYGMKKFRANMKKIMKNNKLSSRTLFRLLDVDGDNHINYIDFCTGLQQISKKHKIYINLKDYDLITKLFEKIDYLNQQKISFIVFREAIFQKKQTSAEAITLMKNIRLQFNQREEESIKEYFEQFDQDKSGKISFEEFTKVMEKFKLNQADIDALFGYFDQKKENQIEYAQFSKVLFEDYMLKSNIAGTIREYLKSSQITARQFYLSFCDKDTQMVNMEAYFKLMKAVGFKYKDEVLEETFDLFDEDKSSMISYEEFVETVYEQKAEDKDKVKETIDSSVKQIRRQSLKKGYDICSKIRHLDNKSRGNITFSLFSDCLRQSGVDLMHQIRELVFESFKQQQLFYSKILNPYQVFFILLTNTFFFVREKNKKNHEVLDAEKICFQISNGKFDLEFIRERLLVALKRFNLSYGQFFKFFDSNENETISFNEFCDMLEVISVKMSLEDQGEAFATFDINQDGDVSMEEFVKVLEGKHVDHQLNLELMLKHMNARQPKENPKSLAGLLGKTAQPLAIDQLVDPLGDVLKQLIQEDYMKLEISEDSIYFNLNDSSVEGKISKMQQKEMYLREVKTTQDINDKFEKKHVLDSILLSAQKTRIDIFQEFVKADSTRACLLTNIQQFQNVLENVGVFFTVPISDQLYSLYVNEDGYFVFLQFLSDILNPFYLLKRTIIYRMQIENCCLRELVYLIKQGNTSWQNKKLNMTSQDIKPARAISSKFGIIEQEEQENYDREQKLTFDFMMISFQELVAFCFDSMLPFNYDKFVYIWMIIKGINKPTTDEEIQNSSVSLRQFAISLKMPLNYHPLLTMNHLKQYQLRLIDEFAIGVTKIAEEQKLNVMMIFLYFDKEYKFAFSNPAILLHIGNLFQIRIAQIEIRAIFLYLTPPNGNDMLYFEIVRKCQLPEEYIPVILIIFMVMEEWNVTQLFNQFSKNGRQWDLNNLKEALSYSKIKNLKSDAEFAFESWTLKSRPFLSIEELSKILKISVSATFKDIEEYYLSSLNGNVKKVLHLINTVPQLSQFNELSHYINTKSQDQQLTAKEYQKREEQAEQINQQMQEAHKLMPSLDEN